MSSIYEALADQSDSNPCYPNLLEESKHFQMSENVRFQKDAFLRRNIRKLENDKRAESAQLQSQFEYNSLNQVVLVQPNATVKHEKGLGLFHSHTLYIQSSVDSITRLRKFVLRQNLLMNMVIHDLRSPTNAIIMGLEMVQNKMEQIKIQQFRMQAPNSSTGLVPENSHTLKRHKSANESQNDGVPIFIPEPDLQDFEENCIANLQQNPRNSITNNNCGKFEKQLQIKDIQTKEMMIKQFELLGDKLQKFKFDDETGQIVRNPQFIKLSDLVNYDHLEGLIKFQKCDCKQSEKFDQGIQVDNKQLIQIEKCDQSTQTDLIYSPSPQNQSNNLEQSSHEVYRDQINSFVVRAEDNSIRSRQNTLNSQIAWLENSIENLKFHSQMLLNLINDLLDFAKIQNQKFSFKEQYFDLNKLVQRAFNTVEVVAKQKSINLEYEKKIQISQEQAEKFNFDLSDLYLCKSGLFSQVMGDDNRYMQILLNLLSNAVKFTSNFGKIKVQVILKEIHQLQNESLIESKYENFGSDQRREQYAKFEIKIIDNGVGIKAENQKYIFLDFSKLDEHAKLNPTGTGLGLSICKQLIEQMGGTIRFESKPGEGTVFIIDMAAKIQLGELLSLSKKSDQSPKRTLKAFKKDIFSAAQDQQNMNFLIANDEQFQLDCINALIEPFNVNCQFSENGVEAFKYIQQNLEKVNTNKWIDFQKHHVHTIMLDWNMPLMKGDEACRKIKQLYEAYNNSKQTQNRLQYLPAYEELQKLKNREFSPQINDQIQVLQDQVNLANTILQAESILYRQPLMICFTSHLDENQVKIAKDVGFDLIIDGTITHEILKEIIDASIKKQKIFDDYVQLLNESQINLLECKEEVASDLESHKFIKNFSNPSYDKIKILNHEIFKQLSESKQFPGLIKRRSLQSNEKSPKKTGKDFEFIIE